MTKKTEITKGCWYVCTENVTMDNNILFKKGQIYKAAADGYIEDKDGISRSLNLSGGFYFREATTNEIAIGRALTEEQQLLIEEFKIQIQLAKIKFVKLGMSEERAAEYVDEIVKGCIHQVYHPKK